MHTCPDEGSLRVEVDDTTASPHARPAGAPRGGSGIDPYPTVDSCPDCDQRRAALRAERQAVADALRWLEDDDPGAAPAVDVDSALARARDERPDLAPRRLRPLQLVASLVVILVAAGVIATPAGRSAAASALSVFRAERVQVVTFDPEELGDPDELGSVGALDAIADVHEAPTDPVAVANLQEAASVAGFGAATPAEAPQGQVAILAASPDTVEATLSSERAPALPDHLDGAVLRVAVPGVVVQQWAGDDGVPALIVVEAGVPEVSLDGADLADLRAWILDDPELPDDVAAQLVALGDWRTTLPVPVPEGAQREVTIGGVEAVGVDYGVMSAAVWLEDDRVHAVAGDASLDEIAAIADDLS